MTQLLGPDNPATERAELSAYYAANRQQSLDDRMTMLELTIGTALWEKAHMKIPRSALSQTASYVAARCGIPEAQRKSTISYGQFYNAVGLPMNLEKQDEEVRTAEQLQRMHRGYSGLV